MSTLLQDTRLAVRALGRSPAFTAIVVLILALGIGSTTAVFSILNSVLIESLPYPDPGRLVDVAESLPAGQRNSVSGGAFKDWYQNSSSFDRLAVYESTLRNLTGRGQPERVAGLQVSTEFLSVLGVTPAMGHDFAPGQDAVGGDNRVVILTHSFWKTRFGGTPSAVGSAVSLDQIPHRVVGILPPDVLMQDEPKFLVPTVIDDDPGRWARAGHWRGVIGRLSPEVSVADAQTELRGIKQRLAAEYPEFKREWSVSVVPLQEVLAGPARPVLLMLLGAVALVLLISCAHVSTLLLARGNARSRESAIRSALGARPSRIVRAALIESLLLALAGCAAGLLLAAAAVRVLIATLPNLLPGSLHPDLNGSVLAFSIAVACGCGLLAGLVPALRASRPNLEGVLRETERGATSGARMRSQTVLLVSEIAVTMVLLVGAGLLLRSFARLLQEDPGFNPRQALAFDVSLPEARYPDAATRGRFIHDLSARLAAAPGIETVGASSAVPLSASGRTEFLSRADRPQTFDYLAGLDLVSGDYFSAAGIRLLRGRLITDVDAQPGRARVVVVDAGLVRDLFPGEDPIGRSVRIFGQPLEIVGVVQPVHHRALFLDPLPRVYVPDFEPASQTSMVVRTTLPPRTLAGTVRKTVLAADPDLPAANMRTLESAVHESLSARRASLMLLSLFALVAIALACIGTHGFVSYYFGLRARELCIRMAFGARRQEIVRRVLGVGLRLSVAGSAIGLVGAIFLAGLIQSQLFQVRARDPLVFASSILVVAGIAMLSCYLPARRVAGSDVAKVLRNE